MPNERWGLGRPITLLSAVTAAGAGTTYSSTMAHQSVQFIGPFNATVVIEVSQDEVNWETALSLLDGALVSKVTEGIDVVAGPFRYIRANVTSYTSGTITVLGLI